MSTAEERLAAHVRKVVASAPPLTDAQRQRLAALLLPFAPVDGPTAERQPVPDHNPD